MKEETIKEIRERKKPWYTKWWAIVLFIIIGLSIIGNLMDDTETDNSNGLTPVNDEPNNVNTDDECSTDDDCYYTEYCKNFSCQMKDPLYEYDSCALNKLNAKGYEDGINCIQNYNYSLCTDISRYNAEVDAKNECMGFD